MLKLRRSLGFAAAASVGAVVGAFTAHAATCEPQRGVNSVQTQAPPMPANWTSSSRPRSPISYMPPPPRNEPTFTMAQVRLHCGTGNGKGRVWVTFRDGVYDVTDFLDKHPGGRDILLQAAGGPVDSFWQFWTFHFVSPRVPVFLSQYRIGRLSDPDPAYIGPMKYARDYVGDLYDNEPPRDTTQRELVYAPWSSQTDTETLASSWFTPNEAFFVRNHAPVPDATATIDEALAFEFEVREGDKVTKVNVGDMKRKLGTRTVSSVLQCAGNRSSHMISEYGESMFTGGPFEKIDVGMSGHAAWSGVSLGDVLRHCGVSDALSNEANNGDNRHVVFHCADGYEVSIPIQRAMNNKYAATLAIEMNGRPLPRDHGAPLRLVVPGFIGARNAKWLEAISIQGQASPACWQSTYYLNKGNAIESLPSLQSFVLSPSDGSPIRRDAGTVNVTGVVYGNGTIQTSEMSVDVSLDAGLSWRPADIVDLATDPHSTSNNRQASDDEDLYHKFGWRRWSIEVHVPEHSSAAPRQDSLNAWVRCRASTGETQPERHYSPGGYLYNGWHKVRWPLQ